MDQLTQFVSSPIGLIVAGVAAFFVGTAIFNAKQWEAHWKQWAIDTSKAMSKAGLIHTPKILDCLAVGDLAGAFREIKSLADVFKDPKQLQAEFATVFQSMLDAAFKDPTQAKALQQLANDAVAAFASGDPSKSEQQLASDAKTLFANSFGQIAPPPLLSTALGLPAVASNPAMTALVTAIGQFAPSLLPHAITAAQSTAPAAAPPPPAASSQSPSGNAGPGAAPAA